MVQDPLQRKPLARSLAIFEGFGRMNGKELYHATRCISWRADGKLSRVVPSESDDNLTTTEVPTRPLPFRPCHRRTCTPLAGDRAASLSLAYSPVANSSHRAVPGLKTTHPTGPPDPNDTIPKAVSLGTARSDDPARTTRPDPIPSARATPHPGSASDASGHISRVSGLTRYSKSFVRVRDRLGHDPPLPVNNDHTWLCAVLGEQVSSADKSFGRSRRFGLFQ